MKRLQSVRNAGAVVLGGALLAALLVCAAGTSRAQDESRGQWRSARPSTGERGRSDGGRGERSVQERRGDRPSGGNSGGEHVRRGDGERSYGGGEHRGYGGNGSREYRGRRYGGGTYGGGGYYGRPRYRAPIRYRYVAPRRSLHIGIGLGLPYYCPTVHRHYVTRRPVVRTYVPQIDVENAPPAGCYYFDPSCERRFETLDEYTDHIEADGDGHANTIEIIDEDSGEYVRTLEFVGGYWSVKP